MAQNGPETTQTCPACGKHATGNFCHHCGAALGARSCRQCGASLAATAAFCNQCGAQAPGGGGAPTPRASGGGQGGRGVKGGGASRRGQGAKPAQEVTRAAVVAESVAGAGPWWVAGVALFVVILVVGWSMVSPEGPSVAPGMGGGSADPNAAGTMDISQMSPREAADRLFDRIMRTVSAGDTAGALGFAPMAVQAFEVAEPLDLDGLFHLALVQQLSNPEGALATAKRMLDSEPDHILGLGVAGEAAAALGDEAAARDYFSHLLRVYDVQFARTLPEYEGHRNILGQLRGTAQAWLAR